MSGLKDTASFGLLIDSLIVSFPMLPGTLALVISVGVGTAVLSAVLAVFLVKCYLNWKRQRRKQKNQSSSTADVTVQQLVLSSQPVDFVPLLIQDQLEEEENEIEGPANVFASGTSSEDLNFNQKISQADEKV